jgi:methylmalonyl-CoA mutase C-terminal domain/subunit
LTARRRRVLVAKPGLDGHDRGARVIAAALRDGGLEVVYTGLRATVEQIAAAAEQEAVDLIGLSVLSGAHLALATRLREALAARGLDVPVVMGGVIPARDHEALRAQGVAAIFGQEHDLQEMVEKVKALAERGSDGHR